MQAFPLVENWVAWKIGDGRRMHIGQDPWEGSGEDYRLLDQLISQLTTKRIRTLAEEKSHHPQTRGRTGWKTSQDLGLTSCEHVRQ